ncbi:hypothetical protein [Polaromonas sp.]|uniref:hypothetical protein n=1 Tax=Polaromonas sp. TaxID=1869339 RepID=UPI003266333D
MTSALIKTVKTTYTPGSPGVPSSPGSPAVPAYVGYVIRSVLAYQTINPPPGTWQFNPESSYYDFVPPAPGGDFAYSYFSRPTLIAVSYPAVAAVPPIIGRPAIPGRIAYDFNFGWNAGGRSIASIIGHGYVTFKVPVSAAGVVAGFNSADADVDPAAIQHAFYLAYGVAKIKEAGGIVLNLGPYSNGSVFRIARRFDQVAYFIDDVLQHVSDELSLGEVFLDASLFSGGDTVYDPAIVEANKSGVAELHLEPLLCMASNGTVAQSSYTMRFEVLELTIRMSGEAIMAFEPLTCLASSGRYAGAVLAFKPMSMNSGTYEFPPRYALCAMSFSQMALAATGLAGTIGGAEVAFSPLGGKGSEGSYGEAVMSFEAFSGFSHAMEGRLNATAGVVLNARSTMVFSGTVDALILSHAGVETTMLSLVIKDAAMAEAVNVAGTMTYSALMQAIMATLMQVRAGVPVLADDGETWVVNDESGASTTYEGYSFNSFGTYKGRYFGVKADGVYLLEGANDSGDPIRASISFGKQDFGTSNKKTVPNCYLGLSSSGNVFLRVIADGQTHTYKTVRNDDYLRTQRVKIGRGVRSTHLTFELYNEEGDDFELSTVEFEVANLGRRI